MKHVFINPSSGLIRAGWRILIFLGVFLLLNITLMSGVRAILGSLRATGTLWFLLLGIAATAATYITTRYVDKRPYVSLGLRKKHAFRDFLFGIFVSALIMSTVYVILWALGYLQFDGFSWWQDEEHTLGPFSWTGILTMAAMLFQFIVVAWWEELAFRGVILQNISSGLNIKWGVILSTLGFGFIHAGNPNASVLSTVIIMIITFKLVYAYLKTGQLWMPIGLHFGWNFFQASVLGFASSGHLSPSLIAQTPVGPDWLSGGAFGAENSVLLAPITLASLYLMHVYVRRSRKLKNLEFLEFEVKDSHFQMRGASSNSQKRAPGSLSGHNMDH